jgi:hypothetical protein
MFFGYYMVQNAQKLSNHLDVTKEKAQIQDQREENGKDLCQLSP